MHPNITEQLYVFRTVVDCKSFTKAAEVLNKTPSSVSYTIASLEKHLQLMLFDRSSYRPKLTDAGFSVFEDADLILRRVERFKARVEMLHQSQNADLNIAVDVMFPKQVVAEALRRFDKEYPQVAVNLRSEDTLDATTYVREETCDLALIAVDTRLQFRDIDAIQIGATQNVLVASPEHPLAKLDEPFDMTALEDHRQIIYAKEPVPRGEENYQIHRTDIWTVGNIGMQIELLKKNLGWSYVYSHFIWKELQLGQLVMLNCKSISSWNQPRFSLIWKVSTPFLGPLQRFAELIDNSFPSTLPHDFPNSFQQWDPTNP